MLQTLFGSNGCENVLLYLAARGEGYAREIARAAGMGLYPVQRQLDRLETGGVLVSRTAGRTRVYSFNPAYPLHDELRLLLQKALSLRPDAERQKLAPSPSDAPPSEPRASIGDFGGAGHRSQEPREKALGRMSQAELAAYIEERLRRGG